MQAAGSLVLTKPTFPPAAWFLSTLPAPCHLAHLASCSLSTLPTPSHLSHTLLPCPHLPTLSTFPTPCPHCLLLLSLITPQFSQAPSPAKPPHKNFDHWTLAICPTNSCCLVHVRLSQEICLKLFVLCRKCKQMATLLMYCQPGWLPGVEIFVRILIGDLVLATTLLLPASLEKLSCLEICHVLSRLVKRNVIDNSL